MPMVGICKQCAVSNREVSLITRGKYQSNDLHKPPNGEEHCEKHGAGAALNARSRCEGFLARSDRLGALLRQCLQLATGSRAVHSMRRSKIYRFDCRRI